MTDYAISERTSAERVTNAVRAGVNARYRAEARFKFYGLAAIALAAAFLLIVLIDILLKGLPAFTQHFLQIEMLVDPEEIDPEGTKDLSVIRGGDFQAVARNTLRNTFPDVTDRSSRRLLDGLLSSGAGDTLQGASLRNPNLIGQTVKMPLLLSDDADLYLKGIRNPNRQG